MNAKDFGNREDLEAHVKLQDESLPFEQKTINGTIQELKRLRLSHGQSIFGFRVVASDYQVRDVTPFPKRGESTSRLDGRAIKIKNK